MNKDNAPLYLLFVQALAEGKTIQFNYGSVQLPRWLDVSDVVFNHLAERYRTKPEPEVVYVNKLKKEYENKGFAHATKERAILLASGIEHQYEYIAKKFVEAV